MAVELLVYKSIYVALIIVLSLVFTLLPLLFRKVDPLLQQKILSYSNAFAGGVFLAAGFVHLFSEAYEMALDTELEDYPIASILAVSGFLTIFFIEQVILSSLGEGHSHSHTIAAPDDHHMDEQPIELDVVVTRKSVTKAEETQEIESQSSEEDIPDIPVEDGSKSRVLNASFVSIVLVIILSAHSFFTGLTMGAQQTVASTTVLLVTVMTHKWVEAFALGANLIRNNETVPTFIRLSLFYTATLPAGVIVGCLIVYTVSEEFTLLVTMIATAFGAGSFVYVAIVDILLVEFEDKRGAFTKFLLVTIGFVCVTVLFIMFDKD